MIQIPFSGYPRERFTMRLEDRRISFRARYASEPGAWRIDILETIGDGEPEVPLMTGRRITVGQDLIAGLGFRLGAIIAIDSTGKGIDPGRTELGSRVQVYHVSEAELAAGEIQQ